MPSRSIAGVGAWFLQGRGPLPTNQEWSCTLRFARHLVHALAVVIAFGAAATHGRRCRHPAHRLHRGAGRGRPRKSNGDAVCAGRAPVRVRAGRTSARDQGRRAAGDAVPDADRELIGRARPARRRLRSGLRGEPLRIRLLHGDHADCSQPHQPLHRQRRRRPARQRGRAPRSRQSQQRDEPQRRRARLRSRRQALRRGRRERQRRERADARQPARQDAAHQHRRHASPADNPFFAHRHRPQPRHLGARACATRSPSRSTRTGRRCSSTTSARTPGRRSTTGIAGANYGWPETEGATGDPRFVSPRYAYDHSDGRLRDHRRRLLFAAERRGSRPTTPATTSSPTTAAAGSAGSIPTPATRVTNFASGIASPVDLKVTDDGQPVLPRARVRRDDRRRGSRRLRRGRAGHHDRSRPAGPSRPGAPVTFSVQRVGRRAAALPVAAQRRQHRRRHRAGLHDRRRRARRTTARASAWS